VHPLLQSDYSVHVPSKPISKTLMTDNDPNVLFLCEKNCATNLKESVNYKIRLGTGVPHKHITHIPVHTIWFDYLIGWGKLWWLKLGEC